MCRIFFFKIGGSLIVAASLKTCLLYTSGKVQNTASADVIIGADILGGRNLIGSIAQVAVYHKGLEPGAVWVK